METAMNYLPVFVSRHRSIERALNLWKVVYNGVTIQMKSFG